MKAFAFSHKGFADICAKELREHGAHILCEDENTIEFEADPTRMCELVYSCQSPIKYLFGGVCGKANSMEEVISLARKVEIKQWLAGKKNFRISAVSDNLMLSSKDVMNKVADALDIKLKVDLEHPDLTIYVRIAEDMACIGMDIVPFDISKRTYKIFHSASSLKGTLAYCLLRWSGYSGKTLLDPCAGVGVIPIEAALFASRKSLHFFKKDALRLSRFAPFKGVDEEKIYTECDKRISTSSGTIYCFDKLLPMVKSAQKNAKIAGVEKLITATKCDIELLDIKLNEKEIDYLVTQPPTLAEEAEKKFYKTLFYQADYVLQDNGIVALLCTNVPLQEAEDHHFNLIEQRIVWSGKQEFMAVKFQKV